MPYNVKLPDPDALLAEHPALDVKLYAWLAKCPLYANVRLIAPGIIGRRVSFWLGWIIDRAEWTHASDMRHVPPHVLAWARPYVQEAYPSVQEASGLSAEEVAELVAEQARKRAAYKKGD